MNPEMEVYFILCTEHEGIDLKYNDLAEALLSYSNIHLRYLNPIEYSKDTKLQEFFESGILKTSRYPLEQTSNALRMLTLDKSGGVYMDLDVISLNPIDMLNRLNFACYEENQRIGNSILGLDMDEFGGKLITEKYFE